MSARAPSAASARRCRRPRRAPPRSTCPRPATAGSRSAWTTPSGNGGALTGYRVYRSTTSGAETLLTTLGLVNSYTDTNLTNGITYYYKVSAAQRARRKQPLQRALGRTRRRTRRADPQARRPATRHVSLNWTTPSANGSPIIGYWLYRSTSSGNETLLGMLGTVNSYTDTGLTNGTTYYYKVSAVSALGESSLSNERSASPGGRPRRADSSTSADRRQQHRHPQLDDRPPPTAAAITGYRVYRSTSSGTETLLTTLGAVNTYTDPRSPTAPPTTTGSPPLNTLGESSLSNERSAAPDRSRRRPRGTRPRLGTAGTPGRPGLERARVQRRLAGHRLPRVPLHRSGTETLLATVGPVTTYTDSTAVNGTTYYYVVSAVNGVGEGLASNERRRSPATTTGRADADRGRPGQQRHPHVGCAGLGRRLADRRVPRLPLDLQRHRDAARDARRHDVLHRPRGERRVDVLLPGDRLQLRRRERSIERAVGDDPVAPDTTPPAKPGSLKALVSGTSQIVLDWADSTDTAGASWYRVFRDGTLLETVQSSRYLDSGLAAGSTHAYQVQAVDGSGNASLPSSNAERAGRIAFDGLDRNSLGRRLRPVRQAVANVVVTRETGERHAQEREDELERRLEALEPAARPVRN